MSAAAKNSAAYWRIAGMSYLKYANACGEVVRQSLKEPFLTQVRTIDRRARETSTNDARDADSTGQGARNGVLQDDEVRRRQGRAIGCVNDRRRREED
jgi:F-type H+-transporting ATPase subunit epsilon|tara:strand:+ start:4996 stop:5289 length:294 start_codon:yes stop_codon:yes gene_type:complete